MAGAVKGEIVFALRLRWVAAAFRAILWSSANRQFLIAANASAQVDPFEFEVYPLIRPVGKGMVELESTQQAFVPSRVHSHGGDGTSSGEHFPSPRGDVSARRSN